MESSEKVLEKRKDEFINSVVREVYFSIKVPEDTKNGNQTKDKFMSYMNELRKMPAITFMNRVQYAFNVYLGNNTNLENCLDCCILFYCCGKTKAEISRIKNVSPGRICALVKKGERIVKRNMIARPLENPIVLNSGEFLKFQKKQKESIEKFKKEQEEQLKFDMENPELCSISNIPDDIIPGWIKKTCKKCKINTLREFLISDESKFKGINCVGEAKINEIRALKIKVVTDLHCKISTRTAFVIFNHIPMEKPIYFMIINDLLHYAKQRCIPIDEIDIVSIQLKDEELNSEIIPCSSELGINSYRKYTILGPRIPDSVYYDIIGRYSNVFFGYDPVYHYFEGIFLFMLYMTFRNTPVNLFISEKFPLDNFFSKYDNRKAND